MELIVIVLYTLRGLVSTVTSIGELLIVARVVLSWIRTNRYNPIVQFVFRATEPYLASIRKRVPTRFWRLDFAPAFGIMLLVCIDQVTGYVVRTIAEWLVG